MHRRIALALGMLGLAASIAPAADIPIAAGRLLLRDADGHATLTFVSRDGAVVPPAPGSLDDPRTGSPGGAVLELLSTSGTVARMTVPRGPGWHTGPGGHRYRNREAPSTAPVVRAVRIHDGRLSIAARSSGLPLDAVLGGVAVRVTFGTTRFCTIFGGEGVRADGDGRFLAYDGVALADCSDATLAPPVLALGELVSGEATVPMESFALARIVQVVAAGGDKRVELEIACD